MKKLIPFIRMVLRSVKLGVASPPPLEWEVSLNQSRREETKRQKLGRQKLKMVSDSTRKRFSEKVLIKLLGAGWREGRKAEADTLLAMQEAARHPFPQPVTVVLTEFGGLKIYSGIGRCARIGAVESELTAHQNLLESLVKAHLHPIGFTNLFDDDGLVLYADDSGRIFADGETGHKDPGSGRIDYVAGNFDRALEIMLSSTQNYDPWPGAPASGVWHYDALKTQGSGDAATTASSPDDLHVRLQALNQAHAALREKAIQARVMLRPPVLIERVIEFEKTAGIRLPDDYVFFITAVGNGGLHAPGLVALEDWDAGYWSEARLERDLIAPCLITPELEGLGEKWLDALGVEDAENRLEREEWDPMRGSLTIAEYGCGLFFRMIVNGPHRGRVFVWGEHLMRPPVFQPGLTFAEWITHRLEAAAAGKPVPF